MKVVYGAFGLALLMSTVAAAQLARPDKQSLIGLWTGVLQESPPLGGEIEVRCKANECRATIAGRSAHSAVEAGRVRFAFGSGSMTARLQNGRLVDAIWTQPPASADVGGDGQGLASPVWQRSSAPGAFRGMVVPFVHASHIFLKIDAATNGELKAAFRNPENNQSVGASQFEVSDTGVQLTFSGVDRKALLTGTLVDRRSRLLMHWPGTERPLELHRASKAEAVRFYPRPPRLKPYDYVAPSQIADGWTTAAASSVGIDPAALTRLVRSVVAEDPSDQRTDLVHSILIARHGRLAFEEYFYGFDRDATNDLRSASKTFASVLVGAERQRGIDIGPDTKVYSALRGRGPFAHPDPRKDQITLAELMTHTSGLACDDNDDSSPGNESVMQNQTGQPDWWKYTLDLPVVHEPGTRYAYCSANINLVGAVLRAETGSSVPELFARDVGEPLQFGPWYWNLMPNGEGYLGGGARLRSRDLLKVGQAYLCSGDWNGHSIVSKDWISLSTQPRFQITPETTGLSPEAFQNSYALGADALAWHETSATAGGRTYKGYAAGGNGGQLLLVFPQLDLAVVITGGNYGQFGVWGRWTQKFVGDQIIPALS